MPYYKYSKDNLNFADKICREIVSITIYPELKINDQNKIIKTINNFTI